MTIEALKTFSIRLGILRTDMKLTQEQLAKITNINRVSIAKYESATRQPSLDHVLIFADLFNVSIDYLMGKSENKTLDKDKQIVCKMTGLNENAVDQLIEYPNIHGEQSRAAILKQLNILLESGLFYDILSTLSATFADTKEGINRLSEKRFRTLSFLIHNKSSGLQLLLNEKDTKEYRDYIIEKNLRKLSELLIKENIKEGRRNAKHNSKKE